jgi:hypothetical protein
MLTVEDLGIYDFFEFENELYFLLSKDYSCERAHAYNLERHEAMIFSYECGITFVPVDRIEIKFEKGIGNE